MANLTKSLTMPNGQEYEFVGKHWYGICSTGANTQTKTVSITGFTSADLVDGVQVTVQFADHQGYNGIPFLNVSSTGAKAIQYLVTGAKIYEWANGEILTFVYRSGYWVIIGGEHATTYFWGKTKLSNTIADDEATALTPKAVYDAGYVNAAGAAAAAPVQSVNGQTGAVSLTIPTVPTNVSDFNNDAGYLTSSTGVTSVNGSTGAVTGLQTTGNLVTSVSSASTDAQYPSAKLFYDTVGDIETLLASI